MSHILTLAVVSFKPKLLAAFSHDVTSFIFSVCARFTLPRPVIIESHFSLVTFEIEYNELCVHELTEAKQCNPLSVVHIVVPQRQDASLLVIPSLWTQSGGMSRHRQM